MPCNSLSQHLSNQSYISPHTLEISLVTIIALFFMKLQQLLSLCFRVNANTHSCVTLCVKPQILEGNAPVTE